MRLVNTFFAAGFLLVSFQPGTRAGSSDPLRQGIRLANEGRHDEALDKLRLAVGKDAKNSSGHLALGLVALQAGNYQEAESSLQKAAELNPASAAPHYGLAMLHEKFNRAEAAKAAWRQFIQLTPDNEVRAVAQKHLERLGQ